MAQLNADADNVKIGRSKERYPIITLVMYFDFDYKRHWKKHLNYLKIPNELKPFINDYRINLFKLLSCLMKSVHVQK